jgi:hypothetical protein
MKRPYFVPALAFAVLLFMPLGGLSYGAEKLPSGFSLQDLQAFISGAAGELHQVLKQQGEANGLPPEGKVLRVKHLLEFFLNAAPKTAEWQHEITHAKDALDLVDRALGRVQARDPRGARAFLQQALLHVGALQGVLGVRVLNR